jgi:signal transduction histidine kinase
MEQGQWSGESTLRDQRGGPPIPVTVSSFLMVDPVTKEPFAIATVQRDIAERLAVEAKLRDVAVDRHDLLHRLVVAQEAERARIAADVHDDSVQALAAVDLRLGLLRRRLSPVMPESDAMIGQLQDTVSRATDRLRQLLFDLEPAAAGASLVNGLQDVAGHILEDGVIEWTLAADDPKSHLAYAERVEAIRIAKEALFNARAHSHASKVSIRVESSEGGVEIAICDNGVGVDPESVRSRPGHRGLATMRDRAEIAGGWWRVEGSPGSGTTVRFWLPCIREGLDR